MTKDKDFVIKGQKEVLEKMRMHCGESAEEMLEKGDCTCNGIHDCEQALKLNATQEELESTSEKMEDLKVERTNLHHGAGKNAFIDQSEKMESLNNDIVAMQEKMKIKSSHPES